MAAVASLVLTQAALGADCPTAGTEVATVAEVVDGDTLRLSEGATVRLAGIEVPKRPLSASADAPWPAGEAAREGLRALIGDATTVSLVSARDQPDRYGRRHVFIFLTDGRRVQTEMVRDGFARVRWLPEESQCFQTLLADENAATARRRGIWASPDYRPRNANDPSLLERNGLYELVEGRIVSVGHGTRMVFLDFGRSYRRFHGYGVAGSSRAPHRSRPPARWLCQPAGEGPRGDRGERRSGDTPERPC